MTAAAASGLSSEQFDELTENIRPRLQAYALRRLGNPDDAEEAVQDTLISVWMSSRAPRNEVLLRRWCYVVLKNKIMDRWRASNRLPTIVSLSVTPEDDHPLSASASPDEAVIMEDALATLDPIERRILYFTADGFTVPEMAERLNLNVRSVMRILASARRKARTALGNDLGRTLLAPAPPLVQLKAAVLAEAEPDALDRLAALLDDLPGMERAVLEAWFFDAGAAYGSFASVAERLGVTEEAARARLQRARRHFTKAWERP